MRRAAISAIGLLPSALATALATAPAQAVFDLASTTPASLGSASVEAPGEPLFPSEPGSFRASASHASLFEAPDLAAEGLALEAPVPGGLAALTWTLIRAPGARESTASIAWTERAGAPLELGVRAERLAFSADGAAGLSGFAAGGRAAARIGLGRALLEATCAADRLVRSDALERAGVRPALTVGLGVSARGARLTYAERWEADGGRSPRLVLDLPLGESLRARFGRGGEPGRIGAAFAVRIGSIEVSCGRLDFSTGGAISSAALAWRLGGGRSHAAQTDAQQTAEPTRLGAGHAGTRSSGAQDPRGHRPASPSGPSRAALLGPGAFAIMRRCGRIRCLAGGFRAAHAVLLLLPGSSRADSSAVWLPPPREEVESVERLEEPPDARADRGFALARFGRSAEGSWGLRRVAASWVGRDAGTGAAPAGAASAVLVDGRARPTVALALARVRVTAGRFTTERAPWLLAKRLGLARSFARVPEARAAPIRSGAPAGASSPAADGIAAELSGRHLRPWFLAGRGATDGAALASAGVAGRARSGEGVLAAGLRAARPFFSLAGEWRGPAASAALELLLEAGRRGALARITTRRSGVEFWCRWAYQSGERRPVAGEGGAVARGRRGSARLTWRAWTPAALRDNGALELEGATELGPGRPVRARVGERPGSPAGTRADSPGGAPAERYAVLDATLARAGARSLALLGSVRRAGGRTRAGRMLGGRVTAGVEGGSRITLLVQASRSAAGAPALGPELSASGLSTLEERARSGVLFAARGVARRGPLELGGVWEREEGAGGARPRSASVWVRWFL